MTANELTELVVNSPEIISSGLREAKSKTPFVDGTAHLVLFATRNEAALEMNSSRI